MKRQSLKTALAMGLVVSLGGCLFGESEAESIWPPDDFLLKVERIEVIAGLPHVRQSLWVDAAGLAVYRESDRSLVRPDGDVALPVFRRMCVYRLEQVSVRMLARELHRAKILEVAPLDRDADGGRGQEIVMDWRAFGRNHSIQATSDRHVGLARLLRIANAYVPDGTAFAFPGMRGNPGPRRLELVPAPVDDMEGAYRAHELVLGSVGADRDLLLDQMTLAIALGRRGDAERLLGEVVEATLAAEEASGLGGDGGVAGSVDPTAQLAPFLQLLEQDPGGDSAPASGSAADR